MLYNTFVLRLLGEEILTFYPTIFFFLSPNGMDQNREKIQQNSFLETYVVKIIDLKSEKSYIPKFI